MAYLVEIDTAAGLIIVGTFTTLKAAQKYAGGKGSIRPLFPPAIPAAELVAFTLKELQTKLDTL